MPGRPGNDPLRLMIIAALSQAIVAELAKYAGEVAQLLG
jgi:hypothetical protein